MVGAGYDVEGDWSILDMQVPVKGHLKFIWTVIVTYSVQVGENSYRYNKESAAGKL